MSPQQTTDGKLERTLGLPAALTIGIGTMVGAGIFVFPGIAAGYAGPAAMISFALGGVIAFFVAASTAELATAMPASGGGYYFISRTFGPLLGILVGIGQWFGLIFASAFYLVGFGQYAQQFLIELGFSLSDPSILLAMGTALFLMVVNILGTEGVGELQNSIVVALTGLLSLLFGYGIFNAIGWIGKPAWPIPFAPKGIFPIFTTTALIFTSYLGFVQIATVAGEIKKPYKNLPRALMGSVIVVTLLYVIALFVSTTTLPSDRLAELGETAMINVARELIGYAGALIILGAGLLATLSSANASILSSSRAVFALSNDDLIPSVISRVNDRFGTPHLALFSVGLPIAALTWLDNVEILAEVASLLHLILYGLICVSLLTLRKRNPIWYAPTYRVPGGNIIPTLGAVASFGLVLMMKPLSLFIGGGIMGLSIIWYYTYIQGTSLPMPIPPHIKPPLRQPRIILPVELPNPTPPPVPLLQAFRSLKLYVLGVQIIPEQTSPEQARTESEEPAERAMKKYLDDFSLTHIDLDHELIFTPDLTNSLSQFADEINAHALLTPQPMESLNRILVPVYREDQINARLGTILRELAESSHLPISLMIMPNSNQAKESKQTSEHHQDYLKKVGLRQFQQSGLNRDQIRIRTVRVGNIVDAVGQIAAPDDLVIISESQDVKRKSWFSSIHDDLQEIVTCPTLLVFQDRTEKDQQVISEQEEAETVTSKE
jgi:amino acid transporter